jgi:hypothetical protein
MQKSDPTMNQVNLTSAVTGILPAVNGGTGVNAGTAPTGSLLIGNGSGFTLSPVIGDATIAANGTLTLATQAGLAADTYTSVTVNTKGLVTAGSTNPVESALTISNG